MKPDTAVLLRIACLLGCAWFFAATLYAACFIELGFDPAYHATVAKNFATGHGWVSSYDRWLPHNPDVTTGPTMLLPAAAMIALFGNALWVPGLTAALLHLGVFLLLLRQLHRVLPPEDASFPALALLLCLLFSLYAHTWWLSLTADFLVCLLLALAMSLAVSAESPDARRTPWPWLIVGLVLGAALLAKVLAWFGILALAIWSLGRGLHGPHHAHELKRAALVGLGIVATLAPWKLYEQASLRTLDAAERLERAEYAQSFFRIQGSGVAEWTQRDSTAVWLMDNLTRNTDLLLDHWHARYGIPASLGLLLILLPLAHTIFLLRRPRTPLRELMLLLGLTAVLQYGWLLLISQSWNAKYALTPTVFTLLMVALEAARQHWSRYLIPALAASIMLLPDITRLYVTQLLGFGAGTSAYTRDLRLTRDYLLQQPPPAPLAGCGWVFAPWETEYALAGSGHFQDGRRLIREALASSSNEDDTPGTAVDTEYRWTRPVSFTLVANRVFWNISDYRDECAPVLQACEEQVLLSTEFFLVAHCSAAALQRHIDLHRDRALLPDGRGYRFVHKPAPLPVSR